MGILGVVALARYHSRPRPRPGIVAAPEIQELPAPTASTPSPPPLQVEVAGIRTFYDAQNQPQVRALVINHGLESLHGNVLAVALRSRQAAADSPPLARFTIKVDRDVKPGEFQEIQAPLEAFGTLAALPPWQQLRADVERR